MIRLSDRYKRKAYRHRVVVVAGSTYLRTHTGINFTVGNIVRIVLLTSSSSSLVNVSFLRSCYLPRRDLCSHERFAIGYFHWRERHQVPTPPSASVDISRKEQKSFSFFPPIKQLADLTRTPVHAL